MNITFKELPAGRTSTNAYAEEAAALRSNPGQWAHFEDFDSRSVSQKSSLAQCIKSGRLRVFTAGEFEARVIKGQLWARYVGPTE